MTALALTPQPITASVLLQITGAPAGALTITRVDENGVGLVRLRTGQVPIAGALTVVDNEASMTGSIRYDVLDSASATTSGTTSLNGLVGNNPFLSAVQLPQQTVVLESITGYGGSRQSSSTVHDIVGRADPVVVLGPARTRAGRLTVWCSDYAQAQAVQDMFAMSRVLMLRQPTHPGLDMYFTASNSDLEPLTNTDEGWRWQAVCEYREVRSPNSPLLGAAGWTYANVPGAYPTYAAVRGAFTDYGDLAAGP